MIVVERYQIDVLEMMMLVNQNEFNTEEKHVIVLLSYSHFVAVFEDVPSLLAAS